MKGVSKAQRILGPRRQVQATRHIGMLEGEAGEPSYRRLVLRSVAHVIRLYSSSLVTECEVFLNMLVKVTALDLPLWHRILVLEVCRGFCVEVRTLRLLFQNFDMHPRNTNVVENMVKALARVVSTIQVPDTSEESLVAVAGMFSSKAKGIEWSLDNDASNAAVVVASEAHAITLAVEGLLGVVFTVATLTDEAVDTGEACGVLRAVEPLNSFLASLCKFTISYPNEAEKRSVLLSPGSKRSETSDQRENIVLTLKNVQALRTLFNIAHRLHNVLGPSWVLANPYEYQVLETLAALDRAIHSPHATTQEVPSAAPRLTREASGQHTEFSVLSSLNSQLFESSAMMHLSAVKSLLSALHQLSNQCASGNFSSSGQTLNQQIGSITFAVEKMISVLLNNLHRVEPLWGQVLTDFKALDSLLELTRSVADASEKDLIPLGFQCVRVIMNDGLATIPPDCLDVCVEVTGAYSSQKTEINISLTAIGLLWTATDFIARGQFLANNDENETGGTVRNSAIRTLFQTLGSHGQKLSSSMWEDCLWNYVFPILDSVRHLAATSSSDEWHGKELGIRGGKTVHMLIHHSRNTAQKQWDETLVLVFGGIARLLRSFFPFLRGLSNFWAGWESLLLFLKNSISNGSKEVALAAINCLQTTIISHCPKGNLPMPYLKSVLEVYSDVLKKSLNYRSNAAMKVKQEMLHSLGDMYVQAQTMFDGDMYQQLLETLSFAARQPKITNDNMETDVGTVPPVQRAILEILPLLHPTEQISSMWPHFLRELLRYLPGSENTLGEQEDVMQTNTNHKQRLAEMSHHQITNSLLEKHQVEVSKTATRETQMSSSSSNGAAIDKIVGFSNNLFAEKLIPVLVDLFLQAPTSEKLNAFPEIIQGLGRCMSTRRDNPDGTLWRLAVGGFNRVLVDDVNKQNIEKGTDPSRIRMWKEVADVCEIFLIGSCGRALPSNTLTHAALKADELLEMTILNVLGDEILKKQIDAPIDVILLPTQSYFIKMIQGFFKEPIFFDMLAKDIFFVQKTTFSIVEFPLSVIIYAVAMIGDGSAILFHPSHVSYFNIPGERSLPTVRLEEVISVLQELARLVIHKDAVSVLPLKPYLKQGLSRNENHGGREHLFILFPSFCELVISREPRVRELVQALLRLITAELGLQTVTMAG
ncbi:hypothetical protein ACLOJK_005805 [Asimina triloba]